MVARGEVCWLALAEEGRRPVCVLTRECAISLDNLRTVPKTLPVEPITELSADKMADVCRALEAASGCR